ncbi:MULTISPECIES: DUF4232 domain-containing protein [unclassified Streptomyces]|uniref:DUF4232 domain-containing protein n=1 Tax=unclassified Streptomyces TaxID=2593676 RepID=UPI0010133600|nr:DUF4232 domain-containing protein [Streptomyces sp. GZWMJZ-114]
MSIITPRAARTTAAVLAALALGAGAVACDSDDDSASAAPTASQGSGAPAQGASKDDGADAGTGSAQSGTPAEEGTNGGKAQNDDGINPSDEAAKPSGAHCATSEIDFDFWGPHGGKPDMEQSKYQQSVTVRLTNHSKRTCTLKGFPGVQLVSAKGERWDLARSGARPDPITLKPGDDIAHIKFTVMPTTDPGTKSFVPQDVVMTLPDETKQITLPWEYGGAIVEQSGATHPGTFVDPIGL